MSTNAPRTIEQNAKEFSKYTNKHDQWAYITPLVEIAASVIFSNAGFFIPLHFAGAPHTHDELALFPPMSLVFNLARPTSRKALKPLATTLSVHVF